MKKEFNVKEGKYCKKVIIPRGYCEVKLEGVSIDDIHVSQEGKNVSVEILDMEYPCLKNTAKIVK